MIKNCKFDWLIFSHDFPNMVLHRNECANALYKTNHRELHGEVIRVFRQAYSASFISIESP